MMIHEEYNSPYSILAETLKRERKEEVTISRRSSQEKRDAVQDSETDTLLGWDDVLLHELLGTGTFNQVHAVSLKQSKKMNSHSDTYAMKWIQADVAKTVSASSLMDIKNDLETEGRLLSKLRGHPNIVYLHCVSKECNMSVDNLYVGRFLLMERLTGTVEESLRRWKSCSSMERPHRQRMIAEPVASALGHLHSQNIVFRDLKPSNIGYDANGDVKLFDFGLARELPKRESDDHYQLTQSTGTPRYMSPECYKGENYGLSSDVYSFGLLLWELGTLKKPYASMEMSTLVRRVYLGNTRPKLSSKCGSEGMRKLMKKCWDANPAVRPSFSEIQLLLSEEGKNEKRRKRLMRRSV